MRSITHCVTLEVKWTNHQIETLSPQALDERTPVTMSILKPTVLRIRFEVGVYFYVQSSKTFCGTSRSGLTLSIALTKIRV